MKTVDFTYGRYDRGYCSVICFVAPDGALHYTDSYEHMEVLDEISWPEGITVIWREIIGTGKWRHFRYTVLVPDDWAVWVHTPKVQVPAWPEVSMSAALQRFRSESKANVTEDAFKAFLSTFFGEDLKRLERAEALLQAQNLRVSQVICTRMFNRNYLPVIRVVDTSGKWTLLNTDKYLKIGSVTPDIHVVDARQIPGSRGGDFMIAIAHPPGWIVRLEETLQ